MRKTTPTILAALSLSACATLPSSGPTGHEIVKSSVDPSNAGAFKIIEVTDVAAIPVAAIPQPSPFVDSDPPPTDRVGPGDVLDIAIYEPGVALFGSGGGGGSVAGAAGTASPEPSTRTEKLPPTRVDDNGDIVVPYTTPIHVAGLTVGEVGRRIRRSLLSMSQNPQVVVTIREFITNSVVVGGEVGKPGRLVLPTNRETLSDAIALAGGYRGDSRDLAVRVARKGVDAQFRLGEVLDGPSQDIRIYPGDRIAVLRAPRTFSVMGAPTKVDQLPFTKSNLSLAEALSAAGGANPYLGDPKAIFVFRIVPDKTGQDRNVIYHLNMMKTGSFFLAQRFTMRDKDILYVGNARANQPSKFIQLLSQLFSPLTTVAVGVSTVRQ